MFPKSYGFRSNYYKFGNVSFQNFCRVKINNLVSKQRHSNIVVNQVESQNARSYSTGLPKHYISPTNFQRRILVWSGKYKNISEVPDKITGPELEKASSKVRIKVSNYMIGLTVIGCILAILSGRAAHKRGESITDMSYNWQKEMKMQYEEEKKKAISSD